MVSQCAGSRRACTVAHTQAAAQVTEGHSEGEPIAVRSCDSRTVGCANCAERVPSSRGAALQASVAKSKELHATESAVEVRRVRHRLGEAATDERRALVSQTPL